MNERRRLREALGGFACVEVHAPFAIELTNANLSAGIAALAPVLALAADLGADIVTVHAQLPDAAVAPANWLGPMHALDAQAAASGLTVGLEIVAGFDTVIGWGLPRIGVTLDVGHMHVQEAGRQSLASLGGLGGVIRHLGSTLRHLHLHDVCDGVDHCEVGTGSTGFAEIGVALKQIDYRGGLCLELNPDRVSPEGIRRSRAYLAHRF